MADAPGCGLRGVAGRHRDVAMALIGEDDVVAACNRQAHVGSRSRAVLEPFASAPR